MKLSPKVKFYIAFWSITAPIGILLLILLIPVIICAFFPRYRDSACGWYEEICKKCIEWRKTTYVKRYYYKANLFDIIKG